MSHTHEHKAKLLVLWEILCKYTDESHALNTDEIIELLAEKGVPVARKVLAADIDTLNEYGYEVLSYKKKYYYYYVVNRPFENAEIAMLADTVAASKLDANQKKRLIGKLADTMGSYQAANLREHIITYDKPKHSNPHILYNIDRISTAITENKQVSFLYFSLDYDKKKIYRKDGKRYVVNPIVMVWNRDNYYLICYDDKHDGTTTYRIDRMEKVETEIAEKTPNKRYDHFNAAEYKTQVFSMFGGELKTVELEFDRSLTDEIFDRFGEDVRIRKFDRNTYRVNVPVQISNPFFSWVIGTRGKVRISAPPSVKEQFASFVDEIKNHY